MEDATVNLLIIMLVSWLPLTLIFSKSQSSVGRTVEHPNLQAAQQDVYPPSADGQV